MRMIKPTGHFRRDFEGAKKDPLGHHLDATLTKVTDTLGLDRASPLSPVPNPAWCNYFVTTSYVASNASLLTP